MEGLRGRTKRAKRATATDNRIGLQTGMGGSLGAGIARAHIPPLQTHHRLPGHEPTPQYFSLPQNRVAEERDGREAEEDVRAEMSAGRTGFASPGKPGKAGIP